MYRFGMTDAQFESDGAAPQGAVDHGTYEQALFALKYNQGVAENVFTRRAKRDLRVHLACAVKLLESEDDVSPVWVDHQTIVISGVMIPKEQPVEEERTLGGHLLEGLVLRLASSILSSKPDGESILLINALWVRVQDLGGDRYSFSLKQKWGVHGR
jgi:hypothetical protein